MKWLFIAIAFIDGESKENEEVQKTPSKTRTPAKARTPSTRGTGVDVSYFISVNFVYFIY